MAETDEGHVPLGFRFGDSVGDGRGLLLSLADEEYEVFRFTADLSKGARSGEMVLILPADLLQEIAGDEAAGQGGGFDLHDLAMSAPVTLDAVLARVQVPLQMVCGFRAGMTLPLSGAQLFEEIIGGPERVGGGVDTDARRDMAGARAVIKLRRQQIGLHPAFLVIVRGLQKHCRFTGVHGGVMKIELGHGRDP